MDNIVKRWLLLVGLLLITISFGIQKLHYYRIIFLFIGFCLFLTNIILLNKEKIKNKPIFIAIAIILMFLLDSIISISFTRIPIFSYNVTVNGSSKVYNALGYRIWACEGLDLKVDTLYKLGYYCDASKMEAINSNAFLSEIVDNFDNYKNEYIKISGKISHKESINYIEMQSYQSNNITLNGYVSFSDSVTLRVIFKNGSEALNNYDIFDNITVVGKIWYIREVSANKYIVYMEDSKVVDEINYDNYEIIINENNNCEVDRRLLYTGADYNFYSSCLDNVIVKFDTNNIYEISSVLSSGKLNFDKIFARANNIQVNEIDGTLLYIFDNFNIIKCSESTGGDITIGNNNLTIEDAYCGVYIEDNERV